MTSQYDVIVVGKGNAALCAALSAADNGAKVLVLEAASEEDSGGNSRFAGGVMRFAYETVDDLKRVTELTDDEVSNSDFGTNTREEYLEDIFRLTAYRTDPDLSETLVNESLDTMAWLRSKGVKFLLNFGRQSGLVNGKRKFFGRMPIEAHGGGAAHGGLARAHEAHEVEVGGRWARRAAGAPRGVAGAGQPQPSCGVAVQQPPRQHSVVDQRPRLGPLVEDQQPALVLVQRLQVLR